MQKVTFEIKIRYESSVLRLNNKEATNLKFDGDTYRNLESNAHKSKLRKKKQIGFIVLNIIKPREFILPDETVSQFKKQEPTWNGEQRV